MQVVVEQSRKEFKMNKIKHIFNVQNILFLIVICFVFCGCEKIKKGQKKFRKQKQKSIINSTNVEEIHHQQTNSTHEEIGNNIVSNVKQYDETFNNCFALMSGKATVSTGVLHKVQFNLMQQTLMEFLQTSKRYEDAISIIEATLKKSDITQRQRYILTWYLMDAHYMNDDFKQASKVAENILQQYESYPQKTRGVNHYALEALFTLKKCREKQGENNKAIAYAKQALTFSKENINLEDMRNFCAMQYLQFEAHYGDINKATSFCDKYNWKYKYQELNAKELIDEIKRHKN